MFLSQLHTLRRPTLIHNTQQQVLVVVNENECHKVQCYLIAINELFFLDFLTLRKKWSTLKEKKQRTLNYCNDRSFMVDKDSEWLSPSCNKLSSLYNIQLNTQCEFTNSVLFVLKIGMRPLRFESEDWKHDTLLRIQIFTVRRDVAGEVIIVSLLKDDR